MTKYLAIDAAASCGWAWTDGSEVQSGTWNLSGLPIASLRSHLLELGSTHGFDVISYERPAYGYSDWSTTAGIEKIAILKLVAHDVGAIFHEGYAPTSIKKYATGNGRATKEEMMLACQRILRMNPSTDDEADALWILEMVRTGYVIESKAKKIANARASRSPGPKQMGFDFGKATKRRGRGT